jgi:hypothetical protein
LPTVCLLGPFASVHDVFDEPSHFDDKIAYKLAKDRLRFGQLNKFELTAQGLLLRLRHPVVFLVKHVLDINLKDGRRLPFPRRPDQDIAAHKDVDLFEVAGVEEVGKLADEREEVLMVGGQFGSQWMFLGARVVSGQMSEGLSSSLELHVELSDLSDFQLISRKLFTYFHPKRTLPDKREN